MACHKILARQCPTAYCIQLTFSQVSVGASSWQVSVLQQVARIHSLAGWSTLLQVSAILYSLYTVTISRTLENVLPGS
jgi:hypothetical protein